MPSYATFTAEAFIEDDFFRQSIQSPTAETDAFWQEFLRNHPEQKQAIHSARAFLTALDQTQTRPSAEQGERMWQVIQQQTQPEAYPVQISVSHRRNYVWWAAAVILVCVSLGGLWYSRTQTPTSEQLSNNRSTERSAWIHRINTTQQLMTVQLNDGSTVMLSPQSQIRYPRRFASEKREVYLTGEGFFKVAKNPNQPFYVFAKNLITKVVGTSFRITAPPQNQNVQVTVRSGKVAVYALHSSDHPLFLTANQQVYFDTSSQQLTKSVVRAPMLLKSPEGTQSFVFEETPIAQVFHTLETSYGVTITYNTDLLNHCRLTAPLGNEPFFKKLDLICQTLGATYEVWGNQIIITAKGC
ncbi:FecR family protein [Siphonobacter curvatus]|uniref:Iron dicitrate transport regulator FecR n=1 Tax=Siphonobacter curvatus TaxID=2094562 RepID=A0A2S7IGU0_9BACT|nr:FecR family protein [Siphonobacter curvatus]PQA54569.1 hypothetical protein C5O19_22770 [Siphonobacter curvatus]